MMNHTSAPAVYERQRTQVPSIYGPDSPGEAWKSIAGFEDRFEVSNFGRVRSVQVPCGKIARKGRPAGKILACTTAAKGRYVEITFTTNVLGQKKPVCIRVHRAVAVAFVPNPDNLPDVRHKDGDRSNNQAENLVWSSKGDRLREVAANRTNSVTKEGQSHV